MRDHDERAVGPGDVIVIPSGIAQSRINTGDHNMVFLYVYIRRSLSGTITSLWNNQRINEVWRPWVGVIRLCITMRAAIRDN